MGIENPCVGGSIPPRATKKIKHLAHPHPVGFLLTVSCERTGVVFVGTYRPNIDVLYAALGKIVFVIVTLHTIKIASLHENRFSARFFARRGTIGHESRRCSLSPPRPDRPHELPHSATTRCNHWQQVITATFPYLCSTLVAEPTRIE